MVQNIKIPIRSDHCAEHLAAISAWAIPDSEKRDVQRFFRDLEIGKVTGNQITPGTLVSYIVYLKIALVYLGKKAREITPTDTEKLVEDLQKDVLQRTLRRKIDGKQRVVHAPFAEAGKLKIKNILILYLQWKLGEGANPLLPILKVKPRLKHRTPDYLTETQVAELFKACRTREERFMVAVLFDSGARAEEFHNIRFEDIELPKGAETYVRLTLKEEYSKTKGRVIALYWSQTLDAVREYVHQRIKDGIAPADPVFGRSYSSARKFLYRLGRKVLGRPVHYHLFRHSSATYYADKLNRQQLCIRYGWRFSSPMPDVYISRAGVEDKELDQKFEATEIGELKQKIEKQAQQQKMLTEWKNDLDRQLTRRKDMDPVMNAVMANPEILKVIAKEISRLGLTGELTKPLS